MSIQSINPATGQVLETFKEASAAEVERALATRTARSSPWRDVPFSARTQFMQKAASLLRGRKAEFARTMTLEMGKPHRAGRGRGGEVRLDLRVLRRARRGLLAASVEPTPTAALSVSTRSAWCSR